MDVSPLIAIESMYRSTSTPIIRLSIQPLITKTHPSVSYRALIDMRRREYETIRDQRQEEFATPEEWQQQNVREHEAWERTLEGVAYRLDLGFLIGENDALAHVIYETVMRLPDEVREFVHDHQPPSRPPLLWWGVNSTVFGTYLLDQHPEPHGAS
jgi:hypothetical protein